MKTLLSLLVAGSIAIASGSAYACGACIEDKVAATYDHAVVTKATAKGQVVVFGTFDGGPNLETTREQALLEVDLQRLGMTVLTVGRGQRVQRPSQANQHGWFYPAHQRQPAVINVMVGGAMVPRLAPAAALRIFARHRIPTRL